MAKAHLGATAPSTENGVFVEIADTVTQKNAENQVMLGCMASKGYKHITL